MTKKIFKSIMAVCTVVLVLGLAFVMGILYRYFGRQISTELEKEASYVAQGIELSGVEYLEKLNGKNARITLIDQDGSVLYDSQAEASSMENHGDRAEVGGRNRKRRGCAYVGDSFGKDDLLRVKA